MKIILLLLALALNTLAIAEDAAPSPWGMNYFSFWEGNSLYSGKTATNERGGRLDDGLQLFNLISTTYKVTEKYSIDLQTRLEHIAITYNGDTKRGAPTRPSWRFQGLRIGISGKLASGEKWSLKGAFNTDIPELNGRDARLRKTIFNPGLFTGLNYTFTDRWSLYAILSPRYFFYTDNDAVEPEWTAAKRDPGEKPRLILAASPTINYALNDKTGLRAGLDLSFRQFVESDPLYLKRWPTSASVGPTFNISKSLFIYPYVQTWPFDGQKMTIKTTSYGAWINGVIF
ncbi:MAG: hypothetical protein K2P81_00140 [Bacteriovoracaceae bacterium]|nr:hypothetical protein [Bacteriovoracaceae bacterium]